MSAFVVGPNSINAIATYLICHADEFTWLKESVGCDAGNLKSVERFAADLYCMNLDAVEQRYGKAASERDLKANEPIGFEAAYRSCVGVFKACLCLSYQCAEGNVPERALYRTLGEIADQIARDIVRKLPEFETAPWGD